MGAILLNGTHRNRERILRNIINRYFGLGNFDLYLPTYGWKDVCTGKTYHNVVMYRMDKDICANGFHAWFFALDDHITVSVCSEEFYRKTHGTINYSKSKAFLYADPDLVGNIDKWVNSVGVRCRKVVIEHLDNVKEG